MTLIIYTLEIIAYQINNARHNSARCEENMIASPLASEEMALSFNI